MCEKTASPQFISEEGERDRESFSFVISIDSLLLKSDSRMQGW
jgi:hypothetical protein